MRSLAKESEENLKALFGNTRTGKYAIICSVKRKTP